MTSNNNENVYSLVGKNLKLTSEEDILPYLEEIKKIENLQEIHLGGNTLGIGACKALGEILKTKKSLKIADFADIFTSRTIDEIPDALRALCDSLVDHESLVEINLSDNAFGGRSAEPMVNFLTKNHHFSILKLNNNGLGVTGGKIVADALLEAGVELQKQNKKSNLQTLICGRNRLEDGSAPHWSKAFSTHKSLKEVRMFQNGIRMDGIVAIAQGLSECKGLQVLDLQDNTATIPGSRGIAAALPNWPELETLNLGDCLLKPKGGLIVFNALQKGSNKSLKTLQLQYCDLDRKALDRLASAIESGALANVEKLEINGNWADEDDECITKIKSALEKHGHEDALDELDEMDPEGEDEEGDEDEEDEEKEEDDKKADATEVAAAVVAAPAATAAVVGGVAANAASNAKETVSDQMQNLSVKDESDTASPSETAAAAVAAPAATAAVIGEAATNAVSNTKDVVNEKLQSTSTDAVTDNQNEQQKANVIAEVQDAEKEMKETDANQETAAQPPPILGETGESSKPIETETVESKTESGDDKGTLAALGAGGAAVAGAAGAVVAGVTGKEGEAKDVVQDQKETPAETAAEVAESAQEVPEEKEAAQTADEVAKSAQEVPEEKEAAQTADEVAESAREVPDDKVAAETADEVAEVAKQVPEKVSGQSTPVVVPIVNAPAPSSQQPPSDATNAAVVPTNSTIATSSQTDAPAPPITAHGKQGSVDLSGELYGNEQAAGVTSAGQGSSNNASTSTPLPASTSTATMEDENKTKKKSGFRAAFGAIRELLR